MAIERYEMQIHKSEFKPLSFDSSFKLEIASSFNDSTKKHFENIISSIDTRLSDWDERPTLDDIKRRLNSISNCTLFFHKDFNEVIGWGWFSNVFTYDWINKVHPLPTNKSIYYGGTYIRKELDIPRTTGVQLYNYAFNYFLETNEYMYGYMDGWNKAPIHICHKLGGREYKFIK